MFQKKSTFFLSILCMLSILCASVFSQGIFARFRRQSHVSSQQYGCSGAQAVVRPVALQPVSQMVGVSQWHTCPNCGTNFTDGSAPVETVRFASVPRYSPAPVYESVPARSIPTYETVYRAPTPQTTVVYETPRPVFSAPIQSYSYSLPVANCGPGG